MATFPTEFDDGEESAIKRLAQASWEAKAGQNLSGAPSGHAGTRSRVASQSSAGGRRMTLPNGMEVIETANGGMKVYRPSWKERFTDRVAQMRTQSMSDKAEADLNAMPDLQVRRMRPGGTLQQRLHQNRMRLAAIESRKNLNSSVKADLIRIQGEADNAQFSAWKQKYIQSKLRGTQESVVANSMKRGAGSVISGLPLAGRFKGLMEEARAVASSPLGPLLAAAIAAKLSWEAAKAPQEFQKSLSAARNPGQFGLLNRNDMRMQDKRVSDVLTAKDVGLTYASQLSARTVEALSSGRATTNVHEFAYIESRRAASAGGFNQAAMDELKLMQDRTSMDVSGQGQLMMGWKRAPLHGG